MASGRERATSEKTLVCLLQAVHGHGTIVELRNESSAEGMNYNVDGFMNIFSTSDVKFSKQNGQEVMDFPTMFVQGKQIRYVQIPDFIDMWKAIEEQVTKIGNRRKAKIGRPVRKGGKR